MKDELKRYLFDISNAVNSIFEYLGTERNFIIFQQNKLLRRGIEREFEIIGGAVNRILRTEPEIEISNAKRIVQTRNFIIHNYDKVDETIIWGIITNDLVKLKSEIEILLSEA